MSNKVIYVCPSWSCNLNCSHCEIHKRPKEWNHKKFLDTFKELDIDEDTLVIYFGGEPFLDKKLFKSVMDTGKITCVSSNLLLLDNDILKILKNYPDIGIATSWNPSRFNLMQYIQWTENLEKVVKAGFDTKVLITLTPDLFEMRVVDVLDVIDDIEDTGCNKFLFEPYVSDKEYHERADEWLCEFYDAYKGSAENCIIEKLKNWNCDCDNTWTLEPSGRLFKGCPQFKRVNVPTECLTCPHGDVCRPCVIQKTCSYPKKFAKKLGVI